MTNTEKPTTKAESKKKGIVNTPKANKKNLDNAPVKKPETKKEENQKQEDKKQNLKNEKTETKKPSKIKKETVVINAKSIPVSTKYSIAICKFINHKKINDAIKDLEEVLVLKKAIPMKGEIPHRKGKIMSGRFPVRAAKAFIPLLKSLGGNATNHEIENPVIYEAIANKAMRPMARFGSWQRKRTHITIKAREMKVKVKPKEKSVSKVKSLDSSVKNDERKKNMEAKK